MTTPSQEKTSTDSITKAARGGVWVIAQRVAVQVLMAAKLLVLARLLSPNEFGVMGMALLTISLLETFSVTGIDAALVSKREEIESYLDTAWTVAVLRGICLGSIAILSAPLVARFFHAPEVENVLRVIALTFVVRGLVNSAVVYFQREMDFNKVFVLGLAEALADALVSIGLAIIFHSVWALVVGFLAGTVTKMIASYALHLRRPALHFDLRQVRELSVFGRWFWGSNILTYLGTHLDGVVIGRLLGPASLGLYQVANRISLYLSRELMEMISQVTFPMYSRLSDERERLRKCFLFANRVAFGIAFPLVLGMILFASPVVSLILGENWLGAVPVLKILVISGLLRGLGGLGGWLFYSVGRPKLSFAMTAVRVAMLLAFLVPFSQWYGLTGAAMAVLLANAGMFFLVPVLMPPEVGLRWSEYLGNFAPSLILGLLLLGVPFVPFQTATGLHYLEWQLMAGFVVSGVIYVMGICYFDRVALHRLKNAFVCQR